MNNVIAILVAFVLPIVVLGMIFSHVQKLKESKAKMNADPEKIKSLEAELRSIKNRLNTLEAIVTDDKYELNKEFSKLK